MRRLTSLVAMLAALFTSLLSVVIELIRCDVHAHALCIKTVRGDFCQVEAATCTQGVELPGKPLACYFKGHYITLVHVHVFGATLDGYSACCSRGLSWTTQR